MESAYKQGQIDLLKSQIASLEQQLATLIVRKPFEVDPFFSTESEWYSILKRSWGENGVTYPNLNEMFSGTGDASKNPTYTLGYQTVIEAYAMLEDPAALGEIVRLMNLVNLTNIRYTNDLEESYVVRLFCFYTYLLYVNNHPDYLHWFEIAMNRINSRNGLVGNLDLSQCIINLLLSAWCLWLITGDNTWQKKAEGLKADFLSRFVTNHEGAVWKHQEQDVVYLGYNIWRLRNQLPLNFPATYPEPRGAQWMDYCRYDFSALLVLDKLGLSIFSPGVLSRRVRECYRSENNVTFRMDGSDFREPPTGKLSNWNKGDAGLLISSYALAGAWDTDFYEQITAAWKRTPNHEQMPFMPIAALLRLKSGAS